MWHEITGTLFGRWYVTAFGISFAVLAVRHLGARRTLLYTSIAIVVGIAAENGSVHWGFPYTQYGFDPSLRGKELFAFDVPLMVSLSYTFMSYFAFATARIIVSGPRSTRGRQPVLEYCLAVVLAVWNLWMIDPISRLGEHFFLGRLFSYDGPGFWFGLPLGSQLGFALTSAALIGVLTWLARDEVAEPVPTLLSHPRLGAVGGFLGQVVFMGITAFVVARMTNDASVSQRADALAGGTVIVFAPAILLVSIHWGALAKLASPVAPIGDDPSVGPAADSHSHPEAADPPHPRLDPPPRRTKEPAAH
jgi:putative membrane protein